jgi:FkbM family methyltransferase
VSRTRAQRAVKDRVRAFLSRPAPNWITTRPLRPVARFVPRAVTDRLPVCGTFTVRIPTRARFRFTGVPGDVISHAVYWRGIAGWEPETVRVLQALAPRSTTFFDVGANSGLMSIIAARSNPDLAVHAFEPVPAVYDALVNNLSSNALRQVTPHQQALTDQRGTVALYVPPGDVPIQTSMIAGLRADTVPVTVPATTIDDFQSAYSIRCVDLIKIDTEATEHLVLAGATALLTRDRPTIICEVLHGQEAEIHLRRIIERAGYDQYQITENGIEWREVLSGDPEYRNLNYLLVHPSRRSSIPSGLLV